MFCESEFISFFHALPHRSIAWHHSSRVFFFLRILQNCVVLSLPGTRPLKSCDLWGNFSTGWVPNWMGEGRGTMKSGFEKMMSQKNKHKGRYEDEKRRRSTRFLVTINIMGSAGPIRFVVNEKENVSGVIDTALKSYAREGRLPVLGFDASNFLLYCANAGFDGMLLCLLYPVWNSTKLKAVLPVVFFNEF
ncbi:unnamed protein product [Sphenostylis stenocarpa]|uniref:DUF7054 domain-containing protein n=1 Tax=Sphenostylis stenocarpa TaxID=92480 RepID=A0AA86RWK5_9FABA|nr:unnamed protein product [Sphenostylis stenocarpa]